MEKEKQSFDFLLVLRGLLAISVVMWHGWLTNGSCTAFISTPGRTAVWIFFGISGYVISYGFFSERYHLDMNGLKRFYVNRLLRIYPLFLLLSVISYVTSYVMNGTPAISWRAIPRELFMLQFNHEYRLNSVFWTLGIEMQFYLVAPLLILYFSIAGKQPVFFLGAGYLILISCMPVAYRLHLSELDSRNLLTNLSHFFAGMGACWFVIKGDKKHINRFLLGGSILFLLFTTNYLYRYHMLWYWTAGSICIDAIIILSVLLHTQLMKVSIKSEQYIFRFLLLSGTVSYGIYAWHPYLSLYIPFAEKYIMGSLMITFTVACFSFYFFEKPFLSFKKYQSI